MNTHTTLRSASRPSGPEAFSVDKASHLAGLVKESNSRLDERWRLALSEDRAKQIAEQARRQVRIAACYGNPAVHFWSPWMRSQEWSLQFPRQLPIAREKILEPDVCRLERMGWNETFPTGNTAFCWFWIKRWGIAVDALRRMKDANQLVSVEPNGASLRIVHSLFRALFENTMNRVRVCMALSRARSAMNNRSEMYRYFEWLASRIAIPTQTFKSAREIVREDTGTAEEVPPRVTHEAEGGATACEVDSQSSVAPIAELPPRHERAFRQWQTVIDTHPELAEATDKAVYRKLVEEQGKEGLPSQETWSTNLIRGRKAHGRGKNRRGGGVPTRSVVSAGSPRSRGVFASLPRPDKN